MIHYTPWQPPELAYHLLLLWAMVSLIAVGIVLLVALALED